ncbi:tRNA pseudouridine synthase 3 [Mortierella sp. GBA35]|nr:tRNA pseudouridine synthase 3 [Mortierella sp. GBA35]
MLLTFFNRKPNASIASIALSAPGIISYNSATTTSSSRTTFIAVFKHLRLSLEPSLRQFGTSTKTSAGKYVFYQRTHVNQENNNIPFLKFAHTNNVKALASNNVHHHNGSSKLIDHNVTMATNKDRPLLVPGKLSKAERKRRNKQGGSSAVLGSGSGDVDKYSTWSRDALLQRIRELESGTGGSGSSSRIAGPLNATAIPAHLMSADTSSSPGSVVSTDNESEASTPVYTTIETPKRKDRRPFDFSKYAKRHVAFKVAYFGWPYGGFASQGVNEVKTVESELFNALLAARIIEDPLQCNYSRCGRTDRGVSGLGQVIALTVRSALPKSSPHVIRTEGDGYVPETKDPADEGLTQEELEAKAGVYWKRGIKRNKDGSVFGELAYLNIINRLLPPDIRIVAWAPVAEDFNARFHCAWRQYKYFFPKGIIDIEKMRTASQKFLGTHDFRNFCKYDASKTIENYDRTIHEISIETVPEHGFPAKQSREFYQLTLKGSAFLWHQVRCMMSVLLSIGQGLEEPEVIDQLMDVQQCPAKPNYDMASDLPLVLYDCHFENIEWQYQTEVDLVNDITPLRLYRAMEDQWSCYVTKSLMYSRMLEQLDQAMLVNLPEPGNSIKLGDYAEQNAEKENNISLGGDLRMFMGKKYSQLMQRQKCLPTEYKNKRHQERKRLKLALAESEANSENNSGTNSEVNSPAPSGVETFAKTAEPSSLGSSTSAPAEEEAATAEGAAAAATETASGETADVGEAAQA